jgi:hypothetical protein
MQGIIQKLIDSLGRETFPVTHANAVFINKSTTLADELYAKRLGTGTLVIDPERWGITVGLPPKPYQNSDYVNAYNNVLAFNRILVYANANGITEVILPENNYAITYSLVTINMQSYVTLNLNGSTIKVIYDSDRQSPYDTRSTTDYYNFGGYAFKFSNCYHSKIMNGIILGDSYDRSFSNTSERSMEGTYGIAFSQSASYCTVSHCEVSGFMGDNVNCNSDGANRGTIAATSMGDIDASGNVIASTTSVITAPSTIPTGMRFLSFNGQGYSRTTSLNNKYFDVVYYKADGSYLGTFDHRKIQTDIPIPPSAATVRFKFYNEADATKNFNIFLDWGGTPHHNTVEYCDIYNGHRGGITGGGNYTTVQYCFIRQNGKPYSWFDGVPSFPDSTKYGINAEDSYGDNMVIKNNVFDGGYHGILIRAHSAFIENNHFYNLGGNAITIYSMTYGVIRGNYAYTWQGNRWVELFGGGEFTGAQKIVITDNYFMGGCKLDTAGYNVECRNNTIIPGGCTFGNADFANNEFILLTDSSYKLVSSSVLKNCTFNVMESGNVASGVRPAVNITADIIDGCTFNGSLQIIYQPASGTVTMSNCTVNKVYANNPSKCVMNYSKCTVTDSQLVANGVSVVAPNVNYGVITVDSCTFNNTAASTYTSFLMSYCNMVNGMKFNITNSSFNISNSAFTCIISANYVSANQYNASIKYCSITYTGASSLTTRYYQGDTHPATSTIASMTLNNVTMTVASTSNYITYDPLVENPTVPNSGFYRIGQTIRNVTPTSGGYIGWVCMSGGYADNGVWVASKAFYNVGDLILSGGHTYQAQTFGTSGKVQPNFPITSGATVDDTMNAATFVTNNAYLVGALVLPPTSNGCYYECTTAGTTTTTPTFSTTNGATITSGTAVFTTRKIVTWKEVGTQATFKPYGLIS